jgi:micrococcal nuclease
VTTAPYVYRIKSVLRVVDGDSFWAYVDVGFRETKLIEVRLSGVDCPEKRQGSAFERRKATEAQDYTARWLANSAGTYWVRTEEDPDNFGRWLGFVWWEDGEYNSAVLAGDLIRQSLATLYPKRWHETHDPNRDTP